MTAPRPPVKDRLGRIWGWEALREDTYTELDLAVALVRVGRLEEAIAHFQRSIELARNAGDNQAEGEAELLLGRAYRRVGAVAGEQDRLAGRHVERAEAAFRRAQDFASCLEALADIAVHAAEAGDEPGVEHALAKAGHLNPDVAAWWRSYTVAISTMGCDPDSAAAALRRCLETVELLPQSADHWRNECELKLAFLTGGELGPNLRDTPRDRLMELVRGVTAADDGDEAGARRALEAVERSRLSIRAEAKQRELSHTQDLFYTAAASMADRSGRYCDALDILELNTSRSMISRATMSWLWQQSPVQHFEALQESNVELIRSLTLWERTGGPGERRRLEMALRRRRQATYEVEEELIRLVPPPHPIFRPEPTSALGPRMSPDDAIVFYAASGPIYVARSGQYLRVAEVQPEEVKRAANAFARAAARQGQPVPAAEADDLVTMCVDPIREAVGNARRVFVVPSEALWRVPLATLGAAPLADLHSVTYVPSLSMLALLLGWERRRRRRRVERFAGVADPDGTLPRAAEEVTSAASHFYDHVVAVGDDVHFVTALSQIIEADVVHLACHAGFFEDFPEFSYIHVGGRGDAREMLWAQDLTRISVPARLVVLAGCHAGTSVALPGNEYVGLPAAFLAAGTLTVVAPLWAVDDMATARFMTTFYDELGDAGPAGALWRAQCRIRQESGTAHPYYWAGFQAFGVS